MKLVAAALVLAAPLLSQQLTLSGITVDSNGKPVAAAHITAQPDDHSGKSVTAVTDEAGAYRLDLPAGTYTIKAESSASGEAHVGPLQFDHSETLTLKLQPAFSDEPQFTVVGVTDNTYRGGHGSDAVLQSSEDLSRAARALATPKDDGTLQTARELQRRAEANPTEANLLNWGGDLLEHSAPDAAAKVFESAVRRYPQSVKVHFALASAHYGKGNYEAAAKEFYTAIDLAPTNPQPYLFLAKVKAPQITLTAEYRKRMAAFAALKPDDAVANFYYGSCLRSAHDSAAASYLQRAVALDSNFAPAYLELGIVAQEAGKYNLAIRQFEKAVSLDRSLAEGHYRLAEVYRLTGRKSQAQTELATYADLSSKQAQKIEQQRRETRRFVLELKNQ